MNALHQAVARAIADANCDGARSAYCYERRADCECARAAAAAIGVCLAEATRAIEALPAHDRVGYMAGSARVATVDLDQALAVLAALAEDTA